MDNIFGVWLVIGILCLIYYIGFNILDKKNKTYSSRPTPIKYDRPIPRKPTEENKVILLWEYRRDKYEHRKEKVSEQSIQSTK